MFLYILEIIAITSQSKKKYNHVKCIFNVALLKKQDNLWQKWILELAGILVL
jgi:hypothetical protein